MKDIRLVTLVGTKTAGIASDPATKNLLDDGIGGPPGCYLPLTAPEPAGRKRS